MRLRILALLVLGVCLFAQDGQIVNTSIGAPPLGYTKVLGYSGSNLAYTCVSVSNMAVTGATRPRSSASISAATNANPVVFTSTGHGFPISSRPNVTIVGGTGNWTAINGSFVATVIDANTFSIPVNSTAFGALTGTITFTTNAPRLTIAEWAVQKFAYDGSNNLIWSGWMLGSSKYQAKCSDATSTTNNQQ